MRTLRRIGSLLLVAGIMSLVVAATGGTPSGADPVYNATLKAAHAGSTNPGFEKGECPQEGWGWHFVTQGNSTQFIAVKATFQDAGVITTFISHPTAKHAYVFTPGPDTLLSAVAEVSGPDLEFNLSHVCEGPAVTTTVPETTVPETTVPETTVPETTVPETTVPETTVPETTVPETTVPETTVPETTVPETTVPETTVPETTTTTEVLGTTTIAEPTTTTEVDGTTTTTEDTNVSPTTITREPTSTTEAPVVQGTSTPPGVSGGALPRTGSNSQALASTGFALLLLGSVVLLRSRALARR